MAGESSGNLEIGHVSDQDDKTQSNSDSMFISFREILRFENESDDITERDDRVR